jgi:hypothetical protein
MKSGIDIKLVGGIGNQLFGYVAGLDLAVLNNCELNIDISDMRNNRNRQKVSIESLILPGNFYSQIKYPRILQKILNKIRKITHKYFQNKNIYYSPQIGFDENIFNLKPPIRLNGYFQTYRHINRVKNLLVNVVLKEESNWFTENEKLASSSEFTALHIRRGDYVELKNFYGLLDANYYMNSLELAANHITSRELWVFSDDISAAKELLGEMKHWNIRWIDPNATNDPVEQLLLMSKATCLVLANSTFSWWAAAFSDENATVIAPTKWYRNGDDPVDLIPDNWLRSKSSWE